jgi:hypothetical protein
MQTLCIAKICQGFQNMLKWNGKKITVRLLLSTDVSYAEFPFKYTIKDVKINKT